ncbi:uncharacterized protein LOC110177345 isoform X2 [Drosophila serrata]|uniref:uncharacterized protein LOC110177345 isoform X2 n=1 Tax=Drosophila serrata TaxID=7274 RepID=UPI000A1D2548|nr:uncharacterized protein LOC110177345 isoform X2 [Drosophila serrata]
MHIDLKALLLIATSGAPDSVIRMNKRFQIGKASFMVRYELRRGELIIRQMRKVRHSSTLASRPRKRQRRQYRKIDFVDSRTDFGTQTSQHQHSIAVSTEGAILVTTASQTPRRECSSIQMDTTDLFPTFSKDQQTTSCEIQSSGSQTDEQVLLSRATQANISAKSWSTQTRIRNATLGSQTEHFYNNVGIQSKIEGNHETTQTDEIEEQLITPYLQALMLESIKDMSNLISTEVISAVSQVLDIRGLEIKKTLQEQDLPREGALEPLTPLPVKMAGIRGLLSMTAHITSQSTQTEEREEENRESKMAKVSIEMATQTEKSEKERSRWTLKHF